MVTVNVVGFAGSLRTGSLNRLLLRSAVSLAPDGMAIDELDISEIPLFNADVDADGPPQSVTSFKESVAASDGLLIVTPEYNYSIPAVTKNLIDWASRRNSHPGNVLLNKPVSIMSIVGGTRGRGALACAHLRHALVFPGAIPMSSGDVGVSGGQSNFDSDGNLVNEDAITQIEQNLVRFASWITKLSG